MTVDYNSIRQELASALRDVPGVISVGIGKEDDTVVLIVAIDSNHFAGSVPSSFRGVSVVVRNFGPASLHFFYRSHQNAGRYRTAK